MITVFINGKRLSLLLYNRTEKVIPSALNLVINMLYLYGKHLAKRGTWRDIGDSWKYYCKIFPILDWRKQVETKR